jgi:hypothetical protein
MTNELSTEITQLLNKKSTVDFLNAAQSFVELLEKTNLDDKQFYKLAHVSLSQLYTTGLQLDEVELIYSGSDYECEKTDDELFVNLNVAQIANLGENVYYREVFDPNNEEKDDVVQGWLIDDFADIYKDLKIELEKIKLGTNAAVEDALWQLRFNFYHHWGNHCINALRALHFLWYDGKNCNVKKIWPGYNTGLATCLRSFFEKRFL